MITSQIDDTEAVRNESPKCEECDGDPGNTPHGFCTECGIGECRACQGEGVQYVRTGICDEREVPCSTCHHADRDTDGDCDLAYEMRRDDDLLSRGAA